MATRFWDRVIDEARETGGFSRRVKDLANEWPDCACGKQDPRIPRGPADEPEDYELRTMGMAFGDAVELDEVEEAGVLLAQIEERSTEILRELGYLRS